jgi:drug/metabolite transporter (DMT)-like permease
VGFFAWAFMGERLGPVGILGLVAGLAGVCVIMGARLQGGMDLHGVMLCGIAVLALAFATLSVRGAASGGNFLMVVGLQMIVGAVIVGPLGLMTEPLVIDWSWKLVAAFAYTTLIPGLAATLVWFLLVERIGATRGATFHFLNPFFGVAIAAALLSEALRIWDVIGVLVIMAGILAVQLSRQNRIA